MYPNRNPYAVLFAEMSMIMTHRTGASERTGMVFAPNCTSIEECTVSIDACIFHLRNPATYIE